MICETEYPIAIDSEDHRNPRGVMLDNTHCPKFVQKCIELFQIPKLLDLGCAGGGLVKDFLDAGFSAYGIDGSDYCLKNDKAEWNKIPDHLFCADITKPFQMRVRLYGGCYNNPKFQVITAFEVLEHIHAADLPALFENIKRHLAPNGLFVASVATFPDGHWHVTLEPKHWWTKTLRENGLEEIPSPFAEDEFPRGSGNPLAVGDWRGDQYGFHVVAALKTYDS
jgi:SAM-dependent methyltransferase